MTIQIRHSLILNRLKYVEHLAAIENIPCDDIWALCQERLQFQYYNLLLLLLVFLVGVMFLVVIQETSNDKHVKGLICAFYLVLGLSSFYKIIIHC